MDIKNRLIKLIDVKSIVTLSLTSCFSYLVINALVTTEQFLMVYTTIIAFYFGTQSNKVN